MIYRFPNINDYNILKQYLQNHYMNGEEHIVASMGLSTMSFDEWIGSIHDHEQIPDKIWARSITYLCFTDELQLVGLLNIRYELNDDLAQYYGHIGYGVDPAMRRKGYATQILCHALDVCKSKGLKRVLIGCYKANIASSRVIMKNNGHLIKENKEHKNVHGVWDLELTRQIYEIKL